MSVNDPQRLALTQMLASGFRIVFDAWSETDSELCTSAYETMLRLYPSDLDPYQRIVYAHILTLKGKYADALDLCERGVSEASASGVGQVVNFLAHFGALGAETMIFLRTGQLGKLLQIAKTGPSISGREYVALLATYSPRLASLLEGITGYAYLIEF